MRTQILAMIHHTIQQLLCPIVFVWLKKELKIRISNEQSVVGDECVGSMIGFYPCRDWNLVLGNWLNCFDRFVSPKRSYTNWCRKSPTYCECVQSRLVWMSAIVIVRILVVYCALRCDRSLLADNRRFERILDEQTNPTNVKSELVKIDQSLNE